MKKTYIWILISAVLLATIIFYLYQKQITPAPTKTSPEEEQAKSSIILNISADAALGDYLVDQKGMTLYLFTKDSEGISNCYDDCAIKWPPLTVLSQNKLVADDKVSGIISAFKRTDGTLQVAYNGAPLYYWYNDAKPGDATGQGVGGVWFVVKP